MDERKLIEKYVPEEKRDKAYELLRDNYPVQYIIGNVDFYNCEIMVREGVLIPRFETELLVDKTIKYLKKMYPGQRISIADLGTGSGAIAIALKKNLDCDITAFDISKEALKIAKENARLNNIEISFIKHDIIDKIPGNYDCIISNPPYLKKNEQIGLSVKYEPSLALYAGEDGLEFYHRILSYAREVLQNKFLIAFEIGLNQEEKIKGLINKFFNEVSISIERDLTGKNRYVFIKSE